MSDDHGTNDTNSVFARMSANAERARAEQAGEKPSPLDAARAHLGTDEPRGNVEQAMIAGADLETGELPSRDTLVGEIQSRELERPEIIPPPAPTMTAEMEPPIQAAPEPAPVVETPRAEIIEPEHAADGAPAPYAASTLGELVNLLENGQLSADAIQAVGALGQGMRELAERTGKRQKGRVNIVLSLATDDTGEAFFVEAEFKVTAPKEPRRKTMLWQDDKGRMTPSQPRQRVFFGVKDVGDSPRQIRQIP